MGRAKPATLAKRASRRGGIRPPIVTTVHGGQRTDIYQQAARHLSRIADYVIAVAQSGADEMRRYGLAPDRLTTIYPGGDLEAFFVLERRRPAAIPGVPEDALVIGTVTRLAPTKGLDDLLAAFARLCRERSNLRLVIVGTGEQEADLRALADQLDITSHVIFAGFRTDVPELLRRFDLYVTSSVWEAMPMSVVEAMAGALPIVATAVGGICELIQDGETGLLVPPRDPAALAAALERLLADPDLARGLGQRARAQVRATHTVEAMVAATRAVYLDLCGVAWSGGEDSHAEALPGHALSRL